MDDDYLVCSYSEDSNRHAILSDDGTTGIVYLHAPSDDPETTGKVEATCYAYIRIEPIDVKDVKSYLPKPPPIAKGYASKDAVCDEPNNHEWSLRWSFDGESVVLIRDGKVWALVSPEHQRGLSKAIQSQGPWGSPWSDELYSAIEWTGTSMDLE